MVRAVSARRQPQVVNDKTGLIRHVPSWLPRADGTAVNGMMVVGDPGGMEHRLERDGK
jgi:hypothetical protein